MTLLNYFKPVLTWSADEVRQFLQNKSPEDFNLIDVRQPVEYEEGHLPGARLIPVSDLDSREKELDPDKPTITY